GRTATPEANGSGARLFCTSLSSTLGGRLVIWAPRRTALFYLSSTTTFALCVVRV
uniref:Uncharacterized protein n=1 Tax=Anopheles quadriannulatus TaxID=34691 RepID=A0A182XRQ6_ANOQN